MVNALQEPLYLLLLLTLIPQDLSQCVTYNRQLINAHWRIQHEADLYVNNCKALSKSKMIAAFYQ